MTICKTRQNKLWLYVKDFVFSFKKINYCSGYNLNVKNYLLKHVKKNMWLKMVVSMLNGANKAILRMRHIKKTNITSKDYTPCFCLSITYLLKNAHDMYLYFFQVERICKVV